MVGFGEDLDEVQTFTEKLDNSLKNVKLRGLKEQVEGDNLVQYLQHLFTSCAGPECATAIRINLAYRLGQHNSWAKYPRAIIIKFLNWQSKSKVLKNLLNNPRLEIEDSEISLLPNLSNITLTKM